MDEHQEAVLEKIRAKRGFLLPLHRFMVEFSPRVARAVPSPFHCAAVIGVRRHSTAAVSRYFLSTRM